MSYDLRFHIFCFLFFSGGPRTTVDSDDEPEVGKLQ